MEVFWDVQLILMKTLMVRETMIYSRTFNIMIKFTDGSSFILVILKNWLKDICISNGTKERIHKTLKKPTITIHLSFGFMLLKINFIQHLMVELHISNYILEMVLLEREITLSTNKISLVSKKVLENSLKEIVISIYLR